MNFSSEKMECPETEMSLWSSRGLKLLDTDASCTGNYLVSENVLGQKRRAAEILRERNDA